MNKSVNPEFFKAFNHYKAMLAYYGEDHPITEQAFLLTWHYTPDHIKDEMHQKAKELNLLPPVSGYTDDGEPMYSLEDVAKHFGVSFDEAEQKLLAMMHNRQAVGLSNEGFSLIQPSNSTVYSEVETMKGLINSQYQGIDCQFTDDGWFNATLAAKPYNKRPIDWIRLDETQEYIAVLSEQMGISEPKSLIKAKRNNGTWLHPKLAVPFTRWLDVRFAVWCDLQIDQLIRGNHPVMDVRRLRHQLASTYKAVCSVLQISRQQQGKDTKPHHFMNEARLINWAMTGQFTGLDRDSLSYDEMDLLAELENYDLVLIGSQCSYEQRKTALSIFSQNFRAKRQALCHQSNQQGAIA